MNILPKKSWHVRNKDNVARVRRDEAAAEVERRKRDARALRAEQEVRTELLRKRARLGGRGRSPPSPGGLFPPAEEAPNREHEEEKRREQVRAARGRALGLLTYLGQSAAEAQLRPPWYLRPPERRPRSPGAPPDPPDPPDRGDPPDRAGKAAREGEGKRRSERRAGPVGLAELRRQRLAREAAERARSRELLARAGDPRKLT
ncbi:leukocyte receptor cluster member 1 [Chamaea fasciata]|uniref:leukocyte receptor cluster member 1 n=1 Tax=Chamaea fasciata TaxID=190680 RepID=UPI003369FFB7